MDLQQVGSILKVEYQIISACSQTSVRAITALKYWLNLSKGYALAGISGSRKINLIHLIFFSLLLVENLLFSEKQYEMS